MTQSTPNLNLLLYNSTTDQAATFASFRADLAGISGTSNMSLIDTAYGSLETRVDNLESLKSAIQVDASYVSSNYYEATVALISSYSVGMSILLRLDTDSAGTVTLKINALATVSVMKINASGTPVNMDSGELQSQRYYLFIYDGTRWVWADSTSVDQVYHSGASGNVVLINSDASISNSTTPSLLISGTTNSATSKTTPVDADELPLVDSAAGNILKKLTWANLKALIKNSIVTGTEGNVVTVGATSNLIGTTTPSGFIDTTVTAASAKTTPVGADYYPIIDSENSNVLKKITHTNLSASMVPTDYFVIRCVAYDADCPANGTTGIAGAVPMPYTGTIVSIFGDVDTAGTTGTMTVDVNKNGTTIMATTKLNWDSTEKSTRTYSGTAATLSTTAITAGDLFTIDLDTNHTTKAKGLTITIGVKKS